MVTAIPKDLAGKLEPAEIYHQVLEHRWYKSENESRDVPIEEAVSSYISNVLVHRRDEEALIQLPTDSITMPSPIPSGTITVDNEDGEVDWRDLV